MCVIIYIPKEETISNEELLKAWNTNPHGAGYSIQKDGKVYFERGFMDFNSYLEAIEPLVGKYNLLLHLRISTSNKVNKVQTHPYKKGNVTITKGWTKKPVICMNGVITNQIEYKNCNDTMSYIVDHMSAFSRINQDILNIIEEATGAKWAVMLPEETLLSSEFKEYEGRFYSNKNHLVKHYYNFSKRKRNIKNNTFYNMISKKKLREEIKSDKLLYDDVRNFIDEWCNYDLYNSMCYYCCECLEDAKTIDDVERILIDNYWWSEPRESTNYEDACCLGNYDTIDYNKKEEEKNKEYLSYLFEE